LSLLNKDEQLKLFSEVAYRISHETQEKRRFDLISHAFEKLDFAVKFRWRIGQLIADGQIIKIKYGYGDYGDFDITQISYPVERPESDDAFQSDESIFFNHSSPPSESKVLPPKLDSPHISYSQIWLFEKGKQVGIATIDSSEGALFSADVREALDPYKHLMVLALDPAETSPDDEVMSFIARKMKKQILVLGKDNGLEIERLRWIIRALEEMEYKPVLVKDFQDLPELTNEQKVRFFMTTSRFVVIEDSFPSGAIAEMNYCRDMRVITACFRQTGRGSTYMVRDLPIDFKFIRDFEYDGTEDSVRNAVKEAARWSEEQLAERAKQLRQIYPWRALEIDSTSKQSDAN